MTALTRITDGDSWLDLHHGEQAIVAGFVEIVVSDGITVSFNDWSQLMIDCPGMDELIDLLDEDITLKVTRTEDGVSADKEAILEALSKINEKAGDHSPA